MRKKIPHPYFCHPVYSTNSLSHFHMKNSICPWQQSQAASEVEWQWLCDVIQSKKLTLTMTVSPPNQTSVNFPPNESDRVIMHVIIPFRAKKNIILSISIMHQYDHKQVNTHLDLPVETRGNTWNKTHRCQRHNVYSNSSFSSVVPDFP